VRVGKSPPLEALASQAEEASRISDVINAAADLKRQEILFLRLINPECTPQQWRTLFYPADKLILPVEPLIPEQRIALAQYYRPDLRQAQIDLSNSELEVVRTQNGLLPVLDLVSELGYTGVGDTFGQAFKEMKDRDFRNWRVGLQFSYPLQNRAARADNRRANFQKSLAEEAIHNFCQIIEVDIRTAVIEIERTKRLIESTEITRKLREEELAAEIEKYRVGRSTSLLVAQAQRDLTDAELQEVSAEVSNIRSYLQLYRSEGTSLQRLGIQPITITAASGVPRD
jgi:outer membrane protein TolC